MKIIEICFVLLLFTVLLPTSSISQSVHYGPFARGTHYLQCLDVLDSTDVNIHTGLRNIYRKDLLQYIDIQDKANKQDLRKSYLIQDNLLYTESSPIVEEGNGYIKGLIYKTSANFFSLKRKAFKLYINPILNISFGNEKQLERLRFHNLRGLELYGQIDDRVYFYSNLLENQGNFHGHIRKRITERQAIPGYSFFKPFQSNVIDLLGQDYANAKAYFGVPISKHINIEIGHGNHFIGHGYHSVLMEDYSNNYFYLKLNTRIWKFHYQNLYAELSPISTRTFSNDALLPKKYMASHYLSLKPTKNIEIGLFETVIFSRQNNFEFQYLNPVILYRTVEYYLNSPDNVMIGLNGKWNIKNRISLYGQLLVDEFRFSEITAGNEWWGNKFGFQAGVFYPDAFGVKNLDFRVEANAVRPFTYSHRDTLTDNTRIFPENSTANYSNYNQPLAHPLGANFQEVLTLIKYQPTEKILFSALLSYAQQGRSSQAIPNAGNDVLVPNVTRSSDYGVTFLQGDLTTITSFKFDLSYSFYHNYSIDLTYLKRSEVGSNPLDTDYFGMGIRANFDGHRLDY